MRNLKSIFHTFYHTVMDKYLKGEEKVFLINIYISNFLR